MSPVRAVRRRIDPWAALVLGVFVALAVIILLATPGPWHRVVGPAPHVQIVPPKPRDMVVFVGDVSGSDTCVGILWLRVDYAARDLVALVLPTQLQGFLPGAGFESLQKIVDDAGPAAGAAALSRIIGVRIGSWAALDSSALRLAFAQFFPVGDGRAEHAIFRSSWATWSVRPDTALAWARQLRFLAQGLGTGRLRGLNAVAFADYTLGSGDVTSDLNLQDAAALGAMLGRLLPGQVVVSALPAVEQTTAGSALWRLRTAPLLALRTTLDVGLLPVARPVVIARRATPARVVAVVPAIGGTARSYLKALHVALVRSSAVPVGVVPVVAARDPLVTAARLDAVLSVTSPQGVVVALGWGGGTRAQLEATLDAVVPVLERRGQAAILSGVPQGLDAPSRTRNQVIVAAAKESGLPLSAAATTMPRAAPSAAARVTQAAITRWATLNAASLARACDPRLFAPRALATELGFDEYERTHTSVVVAGVASAALRTALVRLSEWGWPARALRTGDWAPTTSSSRVYYGPGLRVAARVLAQELGLSPRAVRPAAESPAVVTVVIAPRSLIK